MECVHAGARREPGRPGVAWPLPPRRTTHPRVTPLVTANRYHAARGAARRAVSAASSTMARPRAFSSLFKDIHAPRDRLPELAAERHHNRELVLLTTNWAQLDLALNLVAQLEALGLRHHVLFGDIARLVEHVRRHGPPGASMVWSSLLERYTQPLGPDPRCPRSCGEGPAETFAMNRASLLPPRNRSAAALACHAAQREYCLPSAATFYRCDSVQHSEYSHSKHGTSKPRLTQHTTGSQVRQLWLLRHHYTARLLNMR